MDSSLLSSIPLLDGSVMDMFECGCCYTEMPFDYMVQCTDGHLFCCQCLERYAQEAIYGQGKCKLNCMKGGCDCTFPISEWFLCLNNDNFALNFYFPPGQLIKPFPATLYSKYEERMASECLNMAALENFVRCQFCNYGAILDSEETFFQCLQCRKVKYLFF